MECVEFSKKAFSEFISIPKFNESISKMMTMLMFKDNPQLCPYTEFNEINLWNKVTNTFINDCCTILSILFIIFRFT